MLKTFSVAALAIGAAGLTQAAVSPDIAQKLVNIGRGVCVAQTDLIYRPMHPMPPYKGVAVTRNASFGPDPMDVLDVFSPEKGGGNRPVLIYSSGGAGNKTNGKPDGDAFYDNIMLWAVKSGMVGVNIQRKPNPPGDPLGAAKDIAHAIEWVQKNISSHKGNPNRIFIWAQSAGNVPVGTYVGHPDLYTAKGVGIKGVVFMSAPGFNILPATPAPAPAGGGGGGFGACNNADGTPAAPAAGRGGGGAKGGAPGGGGGAAKGGAPGGAGGRGGGGRGAGGGQQLADSNLPGLVSSKLPFLISVAELDPQNVISFATALRDALTMAGRMPNFVTFKDHSHISEVMSVDTADDSVTGPILKWMKSVK
jgi:hypothetical protein